MQRLIFDHDYALPPEQVFAYLSEHENLGDLFGAKVTRLKDGSDGNRNGVGSSRELKVGPARPFEETVTERTVRFRTVGDLTLTGCVESDADTIPRIIEEIAVARVTERGATRGDDRFSEAGMEDRKKEGYF